MATIKTGNHDPKVQTALAEFCAQHDELRKEALARIDQLVVDSTRQLEDLAKDLQELKRREDPVRAFRFEMDRMIQQFDRESQERIRASQGARRQGVLSLLSAFCVGALATASGVMLSERIHENRQLRNSVLEDRHW